jgi:hypothetical protein
MTGIRSLYEWVTLRDYEAAKEHATNEVAERFSRGNTLSQENDSSLEETDLARISIAADAAMMKIERRLP